MRRQLRPVSMFLVLALAGALPVKEALPQDPPAEVALPEAPPLILRGRLTDKDPLDRMRPESRHKIHELRLEKGKAYVIELHSHDFSPALRLEDLNGRVLHSQSAPTGGTALLGCNIGWSGTYRLITTTQKEGEAGRYALSVERFPAGSAFAQRGALYHRALALNAEGVKHYSRGDYDDARKLFQQAVTLYSKLYPVSRYPERHPAQATTLENLGLLLRARREYGAAEQCLRDALAMRRKLYPPDHYPEGHTDLAASLNNLGSVLQARGTYGPAEECYRDALAMFRALYPKDRYRDGHPHLATSLTNLGLLLRDQGAYVLAEPLLREALAVRRKLYPKARYREGHSKLAASLHNLGNLLRARGEYGPAEQFLRDALGMFRTLYPKEHHRDGHPDLAANLNNLGLLLRARGGYGPAEQCHRDGLAMFRTLYPKERYPDGHPDLAAGLNNLGNVLQAQGEYGPAEQSLREALAMFRTLYPKERYPDGHPDLASGLNNLGIVLQAQGEYGPAEQAFREALAMRRGFYRPDRCPNGHPDLATSLNNLGTLLRERGEYEPAEECCRGALAMRRKLYPKDRYPAGHPDLIAGLNSLGLLLRERGEYGPAEQSLREVVAICRKLYPKERYQEGHPDLATSLSNLGCVLQTRGEYGPAEECYRDALAMFRTLYPKERYSDGHPDLAAGLNGLGLLLRARGEYGPAEQSLREVVAICRKLYPKERYPEGHPNLATSLHHLGSMLRALGKDGTAEECYRDALAMRRKFLPVGHPTLAANLNGLGGLLSAQGEHRPAEQCYREALAVYQKLYSVDRYPDGHAALAANLNNLGAVFQAREEYGPAEQSFRDALAMHRKLYPADRYPDGHPALALSLSNLGSALQARGESDEGRKLLLGGLEMTQRLVMSFAGTAAEAEALNHFATLSHNREVCLSATALAAAVEGYAVLWQGRAALMRVLEGKRLLLRGVTDPDTLRQAEHLLDLRQRLARLLLAPTCDPGMEDPGRDKLLEELTRKKEELEKALARKLPRLTPQPTSPSALADALPDRAAFLDLHRYHERDFKRGKWLPFRYAAFVVRKGQAVRRVDLGPAAPIENALRRWRRDISGGLDSEAGQKLRELVWDKLARHLAPDTDTVYLCPDGPLNAVPWPALPAKEGGVLLERHAFALVPHGQFLLQHLRSRPTDKGTGTVLALGAAAYDEAPEAPPQSAGQTVTRAADTAGRKLSWPPLKGTGAEVDAVLRLAGRLDPQPQTLALRGQQAGVAGLLAALPKARWAHLATHGFFAAPGSAERKELLDDRLFAFGVGRERRGVGARNPLTQSGLVLAGANLPAKNLEADHGILTAEAIAGMNLEGLRLAVLSACETGLGEVAADGGGVLGLQRAFHLGGCRDVVASLWKVDDEPTAALMALFYHHLWERGEPPLRALHKAQLGLYRHPHEVRALATQRGPDLTKTVRRVSQAPAAAPARPVVGGLPRHWAAFVLSGPGQ